MLLPVTGNSVVYMDGDSVRVTDKGKAGLGKETGKEFGLIIDLRTVIVIGIQ